MTPQAPRLRETFGGGVPRCHNPLPCTAGLRSAQRRTAGRECVPCPGRAWVQGQRETCRSVGPTAGCRCARNLGLQPPERPPGGGPSRKAGAGRGPGLAGSESGSPGGRAGLAHHRESPPRLSRTFFWFPTEQPVPGRLLWGTRTCRPALASSQGPGGRRRWAAKALGAGAAPPRAPVPLHAHLVQHACPGGRAGTSPAAGRGVASPPGRGRDAGARSQRRPALGALTFPGLGRSGPRRGRRLSWPRRTDRSWSWPSPDPQ